MINRFGRVKKRRYKKYFFLASEGSETEPAYFSFKMFEDKDEGYFIKILQHKGSSPESILKQAQSCIKDYNLQKNDEIWIIIDKDSWTNEQINTLLRWCKKKNGRYLALSNPKFEYWLLLHFNNGNGIRSANECDAKLRRYIPDYDKKPAEKDFDVNKVYNAIKNAKAKNTNSDEDWPRNNGSTVYRLVQKLITT